MPGEELALVRWADRQEANEGAQAMYMSDLSDLWVEFFMGLIPFTV